MTHEGVKKIAKAKAKAQRSDQPPEYHLKRGDKRKALAVASDPELLEEAEEAYRRDWTSAGDTSNYNVLTWVELHIAYGQGGISKCGTCCP